MGQGPVVFAKIEAAEKGRGIGILGGKVVSTTLKVTGRKLETNRSMVRSMVTNMQVEKLCQLRESRHGEPSIRSQQDTQTNGTLALDGARSEWTQAHLGKVQTYPHIMSQTLGEGEDLREWELRPNWKSNEYGDNQRKRKIDEVTRANVKAELQWVCPNMYAINKKLQQGLWAEHGTATNSNNHWEK